MARTSTYYIGDQPEDFDVAHASGILFIGATYGYGDIVRMKQLDCMHIDRFEEIVTVTKINTEAI
jgi:phosphoglycolate phosphatase-like HAD superfamily hydrolase